MAGGSERWIELGRRLLMDFGIFRAIERENRGPHGKAARFVVLEAPDWAIIVPALERDGERFIITVRQYRHGMDEVCAEFPGGVVELGENPADAAARELLEETGYRAGRVVHIGTCSPNPAFMNNRMHVFAAESLSTVGMQSLDEHELVDIDIKPEDEVMAAVGQAPWSHALMATAAWYYRRYRESASGG